MLKLINYLLLLNYYLFKNKRTSHKMQSNVGKSKTYYNIIFQLPRELRTSPLPLALTSSFFLKK